MSYHLMLQRIQDSVRLSDLATWLEVGRTEDLNPGNRNLIQASTHSPKHQAQQPWSSGREPGGAA